MAATPLDPRRIDDLLEHVHEDLHVELKEWIDLTEKHDQATVAKAVCALANHGGGYLVFGLTEDEEGTVQEAAGRPASLRSYSHDRINGIVQRYLEPPFHCTSSIGNRAGQRYPVVEVPSGHTVPIRTKRSGPEGSKVVNFAYYIRRPGPSSEVPQSGHEWDTLIRRCVRNATTEWREQLRSVLGGLPPVEAAPSEDAATRLEAWETESLERLASGDY